MLGELGVTPTATDHPDFGRPSLWLEDLVRRRVVNVERTAGQDGDVKTYTVGEAAAALIGSDGIKAFYTGELAEAG